MFGWFRFIAALMVVLTHIGGIDFVAGIAVWGVTLIVPALAKTGVIDPAILVDGFLGSPLLRPEALDLLLVLLERLLLEPPPLRRLLSRTLRLETAWVRCEGRLATVSEGTRILASHFLQRIRLPAYFSGTL